MIEICPSILSADFGRLADEIKMVEDAGAQIIHIDVMDGHFVPNLTYGPVIIKKCKELTDLPLDVHLMITNAEASIDLYIDAGADYISVHQEAVTHLQRLLSYIRSRGVKAGAALNPATPVETLKWVADQLDFALIMTVNPGYEAQKFIANSFAKVAELKALLAAAGSGARIQVDGGIGPANAGKIIAAGATMLVAGSAIFKSDNPASVVDAMANANV
jgi:ribulose-phosphate 3-epimerase